MNSIYALLLCVASFNPFVTIQKHAGQPTASQIRSTFDHLQIRKDKVFEPSSFDDTIFKTEDARYLGFNDLSPYEQKVFTIVQAQSLNNQLLLFEEKLLERLERLNSFIANDDNDEDEITEIDGLISLLRDIRKARRVHASRFEAYVGKFCEEFKTELTDPDRRFVQMIHRWHDRYQLIDRNAQKTQ